MITIPKYKYIKAVDLKFLFLWIFLKNSKLENKNIVNNKKKPTIPCSEIAEDNSCESECYNFHNF